MPESIDYALPTFHGRKWVSASLPVGAEPWPRAGSLQVGPSASEVELSVEEVGRYFGAKPWVWPTETVNFLCDVHADADALLASLVATGCVDRTGPADDDFELTPEGRRALFVFGGDYFDKGPSNLRLLRTLKRFIERGAKVELLAGNHDLRTMLGFLYAGAKDPRHAHLFVRMGQKTLRLLAEVHEEYVAGGDVKLLSAEEAREKLFPEESWYEEFPREVRGLIPPKKLEKELVRIREKRADIEAKSGELGLDLPKIHAALEKCRELFLDPKGEFGWLLERMQLAFRAGSFLFVHAGLDDTLAALIRREGIEACNQRYRALLREDPFTLYHGPIGNAFRTKYRDIDFAFTRKGLRDVHAAGIYAVIHGHRNLPRGQRIMMRGGMLNFECDASVDLNTRRLLGLTGPGGAATIVRPDCHVLGISTDHPRVKVFDPSALSKKAAILRHSGSGRNTRGGKRLASSQAG